MKRMATMKTMQRTTMTPGSRWAQFLRLASWWRVYSARAARGMLMAAIVYVGFCARKESEGKLEEDAMREQDSRSSRCSKTEKTRSDAKLGDLLGRGWGRCPSSWPVLQSYTTFEWTGRCDGARQWPIPMPNRAPAKGKYGGSAERLTVTK